MHHAEQQNICDVYGVCTIELLKYRYICNISRKYHRYDNCIHTKISNSIKLIVHAFLISNQMMKSNLHQIYRLWTFVFNKYTLEKAKGAIKNGQSRETGNIRHKKNETDKQNKTKSTTQKTEKISNTEST